ncbi:MAG: prepilin-type N-terminal cleavage/methylation domain-containing protein [Nitrospirae bacterium]|nr:prepilin-type N-terminal cleavage/methylation domain-containing protein [Nitrospirota bacterium]
MKRQKGLTLIEILITIVIISILASIAMPLSKMTVKRTKEVELRRNLRLLRDALDEYKRYATEKKISTEVDSTGYPKNLDVLVEGVELVGQQGKKKKFLRRIPEDPITSSTEWGLRCYEDEPDAISWCGKDVFDVFTRSEEIAIDGTRYKGW